MRSDMIEITNTLKAKRKHNQRQISRLTDFRCESVTKACDDKQKQKISSFGEDAIKSIENKKHNRAKEHTPQRKHENKGCTHVNC